MREEKSNLYYHSSGLSFEQLQGPQQSSILTQINTNEENYEILVRKFFIAPHTHYFHARREIKSLLSFFWSVF